MGSRKTVLPSRGNDVPPLVLLQLVIELSVGVVRGGRPAHRCPSLRPEKSTVFGSYRTKFFRFVGQERRRDEYESCHRDLCLETVFPRFILKVMEQDGGRNCSRGNMKSQKFKPGLKEVVYGRRQ